MATSFWEVSRASPRASPPAVVVFPGPEVGSGKRPVNFPGRPCWEVPEAPAGRAVGGLCLEAAPPRPLRGRPGRSLGVGPLQTSDIRQVISQDAAVPGEGGSQPQSQTSDFLEGITTPSKAFQMQHQRGQRRQQPPSQTSHFRPFHEVFQIPNKDAASPRAKAAANPKPKPLTFWPSHKPSNDRHHPLQRQGAANLRVIDLHRCRASKPNQ